MENPNTFTEPVFEPDDAESRSETYQRLTAFGLGLLRNRKLRKTPEGKAFFEQAHKDERLIAMRAQAFTFGFAFMLGAPIVLLVLRTLFGHTDAGLLSIPVAASSTVAAGVTGAVVRFQTLTSR